MLNTPYGNIFQIKVISLNEYILHNVPIVDELGHLSQYNDWLWTQQLSFDSWKGHTLFSLPPHIEWFWGTNNTAFIWGLFNKAISSSNQTDKGKCPRICNSLSNTWQLQHTSNFGIHRISVLQHFQIIFLVQDHSLSRTLDTCTHIWCIPLQNISHKQSHRFSIWN